MSSAETSVHSWVEYLFDHPVTEPAWHWDLDAPEFVVGPAEEALLIAETFERSEVLLSRFSDAQLNDGLEYLVSPSCSDHMFALSDVSVDESARIRAVRSFEPLFLSTMAVRCSPHLSHPGERGAGALNPICYMWWDAIPLSPRPEDPERQTLDREVLSLMRRILRIPHDACRESALHGLGHWHHRYPDEVTSIIDEFLRESFGFREDLIDYARMARVGRVN